MRLFTITLIFVFALTNSLIAQVDDYAKDKKDRAENRAKNRADGEVNQAIDKQVDKAFNEIKGLFKKKNKSSSSSSSSSSDVEDEASESSSNANANSAFGGFKMKTINKDYQFVASYTYEMTTKGEKGKPFEASMKMDMPEVEGDFVPYMATSYDQRGRTATSVFDYEEGGVITITDENTAAFISFDAMQQAIESTDAEGEGDEAISFVATGNSGTHNGFDYTEYAYENEDATGIIWVAGSDDTNIFKHMMQLSDKLNKRKNAQQIPAAFRDVQGLIVKAVSTTKEDNTVVEMELQSVDRQSSQVSTKGMQIMDMSGFMGG